MQTTRRPNYLRIGVHLFGLAPLGYLLASAAMNQLTVNPIQNIEQRLGHYALYMLVASLAVTPLNTLFGWRQLLRHRRTLGLYAFFYACLHFTVFFAVDYFFDVREVLMLTIEKPYIWLGLSGLIILIALAITSFKWWMKKMGHGWQSLHRTVYLAAVILVIHYAWAKKGNYRHFEWRCPPTLDHRRDRGGPADSSHPSCATLGQQSPSKTALPPQGRAAAGRAPDQ